jgi:hypothetical protein
MTGIEATASYLFLLSLKDCLQYIVLQTGNSWHNMATKDRMQTTTSSLALQSSPIPPGIWLWMPSEAGVVILVHTVSILLTQMLGTRAKTRNPYDLSKAERKRS